MSSDVEGASTRGDGGRSRARLLLIGSVVATTLAVLVYGGLAARFIVWPDLEPVPDRVDAVVELGGLGDRDETTLALAREGRTKYVVHSTMQAEAGTDRCLPAVHDVTILCFSADPGTTRGEAQYIGEAAREYGWHSVVLVTSPDHALRAKLRVSRCFTGKVYIEPSELPAEYWPRQVIYQSAAFVKALVFQTEC